MKIKILSCLTLLAMSFSSSAEFISTDAYTQDDGKATLDTSTGLEWLDLSETKGRSYNEIKGQLAEGGEFEGWRLPTANEVRSLIQEFYPELPQYNWAYKTSTGERAADWIGFFNTSYGGYSFGQYLYNDTTLYTAGVQRYSSKGIWRGSVYQSYGSRSYSTGGDQVHQNTSTFLVSDGGTTYTSKKNPSVNNVGFEGDINAAPASVPVPLSALLLGAGLLGIRRKFK
jgi:hypothetical protein